MARESAGILMFRRDPDLEVFLAHPGGPFWQEKDLGAWTIPKGVIEANEDGLTAAIREFGEETGITLDPAAAYIDLGAVKQKSGKVVQAWATEGDADCSQVQSNLVQTKWRGQWITVPEVDRCEWFPAVEAMRRVNPAQAELIVRLAQKL